MPETEFWVMTTARHFSTPRLVQMQATLASRQVELSLTVPRQKRGLPNR